MADEKPIEIVTLLSSRTKQGLVEIRLGEERAQLDVRKAKEVCAMLHEAIEAAISDTLIYQFMTEHVGLGEENAARALLDFRELRQGSKGTVYPQ